MEKEKKKKGKLGNFLFYTIMLSILGMVLFGQEILIKFMTIDFGNDQWNDTSGKFEDLPVGYSIKVPSKVNDFLEGTIEKIHYQDAPRSVSQDYTFDDLFYGNLRPKDYKYFVNVADYIMYKEIPTTYHEDYRENYNEIIDFYLNYEQKIKNNPSLITEETISQIFNKSAKSGFLWDFNYEGDLDGAKAEQIEEYKRFLSSYDLNNPNDFYKLMGMNYQELNTILINNWIDIEKKKSKEDYVQDAYPERFKENFESVKLEESSMFYGLDFVPNMNTITKTGENEITIEILSENPVTYSNAHNYQNVNQFFITNNQVDNNKIIYVEIKDERAPNTIISKLRLGGYPIQQLFSQFSIEYWHPNTEGLGLIDLYSQELQKSLDTNDK